MAEESSAVLPHAVRGAGLVLAQQALDQVLFSGVIGFSWNSISPNVSAHHLHARIAR